MIIGVHQIPVQIADLGHGGRQLGAKCGIGDLPVGLADAQETQVRPQSEGCQQLLLNIESHACVKLRTQAVVRAVGIGPAVSQSTSR